MTQTWTSSGTEPLIDRLRRAVIGRYDVYAELGQGGMASVFLALDLALDRKVAIKVMAPALMTSADNVERFKREAKVAAALNHPHIIGILAVGDDPELAYFVMKFVEGRSLDSVIRDEGPQSVPFVQSVIASAGKALHYAHTRGVIHRDVKPANFMLDQDGWLVVTDFGIAKQGDVKGLTVTGSLIGTPYYMSPEQFHGRPVSPAADQYALGIVAYELLTGTQPYTGDTVAEVMRGHLFDEVPDVRQARPEVPAEIAACISRMLAKEPEERFATLEDAVLAFGAISPTQEVQVRTQIIELARTGVMQQPQINVPLSPIPQVRTRPAVTPPPRGSASVGARAGASAAQLAATTPVPGIRPSRTDRAAVPETRVSVPAPSRSRMPLIAALTLLVGVGGATAVLRPDLLGLGAASAIDTTAPAALVVDSVALRDSLERASLASAAAAATADSLARVDSIARADSVARVVAQAQADSVARADSVRRAAAARPAPTRPATQPTRPALRPGAAALLRARKDGRRTAVPPRNP
ncbi:MAG: serine/threonine protein kinase [Gemmatimonadaceae bacterium]|nr:serine/threonine protein kinase [Gemmatimonadaceae bacterium]